MKKLFSLLIAGTMLVASCTRTKKELAVGPWLGVIQLDSLGRLEVPFNFEVKKEAEKVALVIRNADEFIQVDEVEISGDTLHAKLPVFTSELYAVIGSDSLKGFYYPKGLLAGTKYGFYAVKGQADRFPWFTESPAFDVTGRWWFIENPGTPDSTTMIAEFKQNGSSVAGTILSTTGDYRYLEGKVAGNKFYFSKNDGAQTIIIKGDIVNANTMINGVISGSPRWISAWKAIRDENATLPADDKLVWIKKGFTSFEFAGRDTNGNIVKSSDAKFKGKVLAVLAGGSWCPNCLDEGRFYKTLYGKYCNQGFEVVSLCFEDKTFEVAQPKIQRFAKSIGAGYTFLYVAPRGREQRDSVLYAIEGQMAYPTSMVIDRKGSIRRVETGFSGPGTGEHYSKFARETEALIVKLLGEQ
ncbi:MAG: TlpA family protein disulfide reductase [Bacteroidales bacterium]